MDPSLVCVRPIISRPPSNFGQRFFQDKWMPVTPSTGLGQIREITPLINSTEWMLAFFSLLGSSPMDVLPSSLVLISTLSVF